MNSRGKTILIVQFLSLVAGNGLSVNLSLHQANAV